MSWLLTRRLFISSPLLHRLLQEAPDATPGGSPEATPAASPEHMPGVDGGHYVSPTYGWEISFDTAKWAPEKSTSEDGVDTFVLVGLKGWAPTCTVVFETSPIGSGDPEMSPLERKMLEARKSLNSDFDKALITVGEDANARAIYGLFQTENTEEETDDHWIASYVARHPDDDLDRIVELDSIGIPDTEGALVIKATSAPTDYDENAYELVEELRHSFYEASQAQAAAGSTSTLSLLSARASGGSRPKVQY